MKVRNGNDSCPEVLNVPAEASEKSLVISLTAICLGVYCDDLELPPLYVEDMMGLISPVPRFKRVISGCMVFLRAGWINRGILLDFLVGGVGRASHGFAVEMDLDHLTARLNSENEETAQFQLNMLTTIALSTDAFDLSQREHHFKHIKQGHIHETVAE